MDAVPVVQGGLMYVGYAGLAAAASNAGNLRIITALIFKPEEFRQEIQKCRRLTNKHFALNITLLPYLAPPNYRTYTRVVIEEGITAVETAGNNPVIRALKNAGIIVIHKLTTIWHAESTVRLGAAFLSIDGSEYGGHVGESNITNFILLSRAYQKL
ncbi:hypothetical protein FSHL1_010039 [Fusarium sambucinum]